MLRIEDLGAWLKAQGVSVSIKYNSMPDGPDDVLVLTDTGGFGETLEGALQLPTFQVRSRGKGMAARDLAHLVDSSLTGGERRFVLGKDATEYQVVSVGYVGGPPSYMETDERGRSTYTCNYTLEIER